MKYRKTYVDVVARIDEDGKVTPLSIRWRDGRVFEIDRVIDVIRRASTRVGGTGLRYTVSVNGREKYLFFEDPRWFVEEVVPEDAAAGAAGGDGAGAGAAGVRPGARAHTSAGGSSGLTAGGSPGAGFAERAARRLRDALGYNTHRPLRHPTRRKPPKRP